MLQFCTYFDSNYLSRGLTMIESLENHCNEYHVYIIAFDDIVFNTFTNLKVNNTTVIKLTDFEDDKLLSIKNTRSKVEYLWTCTPSVIKYCIEKFNLDHCTYLDADLYFFNDPKVLIEETIANKKSVLITEHRYSKKYDQSKASGKYCVQFMMFKNDSDGISTLNWWRDACIDWCYAKHEDGKFGDQKYLDSWTKDFNGIHELLHLGGGVAPWNIQQYVISNNKDGLSGKEITSEKDFSVIFFHFHYFKFLENDMVDLGRYELTDNTIETIYKPYIIHLENVGKKIKSLNKTDLPHGYFAAIPLFKKITRFIRSGGKINYNIFHLSNFRS